MLDNGINPSAERKKKKRKQKQQGRKSFGDLKWRFYDEKIAHTGEENRDRITHILTKKLNSLDRMNMDEIDLLDVKDIIQRIWGRGDKSAAKRTLQTFGRIEKVAASEGIPVQNIAFILKDSFKPPKAKSRAHLKDPRDLGKLLLSAENYVDVFGGDVVTQCAVELIARTFVRTINIRRARWVNIKKDLKQWHIPAEQMKMDDDFVVPLSPFCMELILYLESITGGGDLLFPNEKTPDMTIAEGQKMMSGNTINDALKAMGFGSGIITGHGFRHTSATFLTGILKYPNDVVELQLSHKIPLPLKDTYNKYTYLEERIPMMDAWSKYLMSLRDEAAREIINGKLST
jgi:integrase